MPKQVQALHGIPARGNNLTAVMIFGVGKHRRCSKTIRAILMGWTAMTTAKRAKINGY